MKIIGIGNALMDILVPVKNYELIDMLNLPHGGMVMIDRKHFDTLTLQIQDLTKSYTAGGSASNTIYGLAKLGANVSFIGKVGKDSTGKKYEEDIIISGVKSLLKKTDTPTGCVTTLVTPDSERTFATYLGAAQELTPDDLDENTFKGYNLLYIEGYLLFNNDIVVKAMQIAKKLNMKVALDLAAHNFVKDNNHIIKDLLKKYVDICFANEDEANALLGLQPKESIDILSTYCNFAIIKLGSKGALVRHKDITYQINTDKVKCVDSTGAGDLFASGFIYGLLNNYKPDICGKIGSLLGSTAVQNYGARISDENWSIIKHKIKLLT